MLIPNGEEEGALALTSRWVRPISGSNLILNMERIFDIRSHSAPALLQPNTSTMRMEWLHPPPLSNQTTLNCDNGVSTLLFHG
jgi:hypothetical protein